MLSFVAVIGGIGFFLLGMNLINDGLKAIAGDTLRRWLNHFTGGTLSSISTGAVITLLVQSSTATTLMTIGFVSAGMLTLLQAVGVIFGANLGTTSTGWIVSFIGLKFSISQFALPFIGIGMLLKQFSKGKLAHSGNVISGFGLLFIGIQFLQDGMAGISTTIDLSQFTGDSIGNLLILIIVGIIMTIVMQSSSAAVATTITVLASGVINLEQAVVLVIGQNIGTTATAAFAAIGASITAKRTALSHILFNVGTGLIAFLIYPLIVLGLTWVAERMFWNDPTILLAMFHTTFSLLGIVVFAPFIKQFVKLIEWILPEKKSLITQFLDHSLIEIPSIAVETTMKALNNATLLTLKAMDRKLTALAQPTSDQRAVESANQQLHTIQSELKTIRDFAAEIQSNSSETTSHYIALLHALDHTERLCRLMLNISADIQLVNRTNDVYPVVTQLLERVQDSIQAIEQANLHHVLPRLSEFSQELAIFRKQERANMFHVTAKGEVPITDAFRYVQLILFVDGLAYHIWRTIHHLSGEESSN